MAWSTIRRATTGDHESLDSAATRFIERHHLDPMRFGNEHIHDALTNELYARYQYADYDDERRLWRLWLACMRRALNEPHAEGIAYGYVGRHAD